MCSPKSLLIGHPELQVSLSYACTTERLLASALSISLLAFHHRDAAWKNEKLVTRTAVNADSEDNMDRTPTFRGRTANPHQQVYRPSAHV